MSSSALDEAKQVIDQQQAVLTKMLETATSTGLAIKLITEDRWLVSMDGSLQTLTFNPELGIEPGSSVSILNTGEVMTIVSVLPEVIHNGQVSKISEILPDGRLVVESKGEKNEIFPGKLKDLKEGDEVFVFGNILATKVHAFGKSKETVEPTGVTWEDIGGMEREKKLLKEIIEEPIEFKDIYEGYGKKPAKGVLLHGLPGNGKTLLGKALASSIAKFYKTNVNSFFYIKGPELLSQYVGVAEQSIRDLFATTRAFYKEHGFPAVIFIDEAEAILSRRGSGLSSDVNKTIVPQFLTEMDGLSASHTIVVLATNRPDMVDSAILRDGRIDRKLRIDNPDTTTARSIIGLNLKKTKLAEEAQAVEDSFVNELYSEKYPLYKIITETEGEMILHLKDITSGATLANIVTTTVGNAIRRDISQSVKTATGIKCEDALMAVSELYHEHQGYKHPEQIEHFAEVHEIKVKKVVKIK